MLRLIGVQLRVIHALALREAQSQQVNLAYGFGWVFFDAFLGFAGLLIMKLAIRGWGGIAGLPPVTYLVSGLLPWMMFSSVYHVPDAAIKRGKSLLLLPIITELDLVLASTYRIFLTYTILFVPMIIFAAWYDNYWQFPKFPLGVMILYICMYVMGVGLGLILMLLLRLYEPAGKFVSFFMRFSMILSGVMFAITMFPSSVLPYLAWNPLLHVEELIRTYWFTSYHTPVGSPAYVAECVLIMIFLGLLVERYVRTRFPV